MLDSIFAFSHAGLLLLASLLFVSFVFFRPDVGFFWRRQRQVTHRVLSEDALKHLHKNELINNVTTLDIVIGAIGVSGNPTHKPHGDSIPTASGELVYHDGKPLSSQEVGQRLHVVHLEDEPESVYSQLIALGLHPGMEIQVLEIGQGLIRIWAAGDEHVIAPVLASNISVVPIAEPDLDDTGEGERLSDLGIGQSCRASR